MSIILVVIPFIAATILSILLYYKSKRKKEPVWACDTQKIIGLGTNSPAELKITFNNTIVDQVYSTNIIFYNKGNETIKNDEVTEPIKLYLINAQILRTPEIQSVSKEEIKFSASKINDQNSDGVQLGFLYLDKGDGAVINLIHTHYDGINRRGNIMSSKPISNIGVYFSNKPKLLPHYILLAVSAIMLLYAFILPLVRDTVDKYWENFLKVSLPVILPVLLFTVVILGVIILSNLKFNKFPSWSRKVSVIKTYKPINIIGDVKVKCSNCHRSFKIPNDEFSSVLDSGKVCCPYCRKSQLIFTYDEI